MVWQWLLGARGGVSPSPEVLPNDANVEAGLATRGRGQWNVRRTRNGSDARKQSGLQWFFDYTQPGKRVRAAHRSSSSAGGLDLSYSNWTLRFTTTSSNNALVEYQYPLRVIMVFIMAVLCLVEGGLLGIWYIFERDWIMLGLCCVISPGGLVTILHMHRLPRWCINSCAYSLLFFHFGRFIVCAYTNIVVDSELTERPNLLMAFLVGCALWGMVTPPYWFTVGLLALPWSLAISHGEDPSKSLLHQAAPCLHMCFLLLVMEYAVYRITLQLFVEGQKFREAELLEGISREKESYIAQVAHDIGTPLATFALSTQLLLTTELTAEQKEIVDTQGLAVEMMSTTRRQALDALRYTSSTKGLRHKLEAVEIRQTIVRCVTVVQAAAQYKRQATGSPSQSRNNSYSGPIEPDDKPRTASIVPGQIKWEVKFDDQIARWVNTDGAWIQDMLLNYLGNARKHATGTDRVITSLTVIDAPRLEGPKKLMRFAVKDFGPGIPPDRHAELFQRFGQLDKKMEGMGLGLYGVKCKALALQGFCGVELGQVPGQGTEFWFTVAYEPLPDRAGSAGGRGTQPPSRSGTGLNLQKPEGPHFGHPEPQPQSLRPSTAPTTPLPVPQESVSWPLPEVTATVTSAGKVGPSLLLSRISAPHLPRPYAALPGSRRGLDGMADEAPRRRSTSVLKRPASPEQVGQWLQHLLPPKRLPVITRTPVLPGAAAQLAEQSSPSSLDRQTSLTEQEDTTATARTRQTSMTEQTEGTVASGDPKSVASPVSEESGALAPAILVVDDSDTLRRFMVKLLQKNGWSKVHEAQDGKQALRRMMKRHYVCVLMDLSMPEMNGIEATSKFRTFESQNHREERQFIVALSASVSEAHQTEALAAGVDAFLGKPVNLKALQALLSAGAAEDTCQERTVRDYSMSHS